MAVFVSSLIIVFLVTLTFAQELPLYFFCIYSSGNFTRKSTYETNLNGLLSSSSFNIANDYGFYNFASGQGSYRATAIALCRGDVNSGDCITCINNAIAVLRNRCPYQREAIIWYNNCMFRYTNRSIFGVAENSPSFWLANQFNVTNAEAFNQALSPLLDGLINSAALQTSLRKFAIGSANNVTAFQTLHALVQCTPDLTNTECRFCLSQAIVFIPRSCDRKQGGRVLWPSCNFRYEIYPIYNPNTDDTPTPSSPPPITSSPPPIPSSLPPSNGIKGSSSRTTIIITVSIVAFAVLLMSCCIIISSRVKYSKVIAEKVDDIKSAKSLQYDFNTISAATNHFSKKINLEKVDLG